MREVTPPTREPVTLFEARLHMRQAAEGDSPGGDSPDMYEDLPDDSWVEKAITAARQWAESFLGFPLTDAVYVTTFHCFEGGRFPMPALPWYTPPDLVLPDGAAEVLEVAYLDVDHALQVMPASGYDFDPFTFGLYVDARPDLSSRGAPLRVKFRGGYGGDSPTVYVPEVIKLAILMVVAYRNENRSSEEEIPAGAEELLRPFKTSIGMA